MEHSSASSRLALWISCLLALLAANHSRADAVVANCTDADLRAAVATGGLVTFNCDGVLALTNQIVISTNVTIDAVGHSITLNGAGQVRHFVVNPGVVLELRNMTLANGFVRGTNGATGQNGGPGPGGAIYNNAGTLSAFNCSFLNNLAWGGTGGPGDPTPIPAGSSGPGLGGAIYSIGGNILLTNCLLSYNTSLGATGYTQASPSTFLSRGGDASGGAIHALSGGLQLFNCVLSNNRAAGGLGTRFNAVASIGGVASGGAVMCSNVVILAGQCAVTGNTVRSGGTQPAYGGGISQSGGSLNLTEAILQSNSATGGNGVSSGLGGITAGSAYGGGLFQGGGTTVVSGTSFSANLAAGGAGINSGSPGSAFGGGFFNSASFNATNCTVHGNTAQSGPPALNLQGNGLGGGIYNAAASMTLSFVTLADNSAILILGGYTNNGAALGGGIYSSTNGTVTLLSSIVANNLSGSNGFGSVVDAGYNLSSDASLNLNGTGSLTNTNPVLGPLANYGGPTPTMPLLTGSPALNAGDTANSPATDQRGRTRPYGGASDMGAFESSAPFVIRGRLSGTIVSPSVLMTAGASNTLTTTSRDYSFDSLPAGTYSVAPSADQVFATPVSQSVTVGPDQVDVNFAVHEWNALAIEVTNGTAHLVYAGTNGTTFRLMTSTNLQNWNALSTNVSPGGLLDFYFPAGLSAQFFRTQQP